MSEPDNHHQHQWVEDLDAEIALLTRDGGYQLDSIWPADAPQHAALSRGATRITRSTENPPKTGRAEMSYTDLVADRLGGRLIASRIHVPGSGPVPDSVHWHDVDFQMILCLEGSVDLVYEDQGEPFTLHAGDFVTQPPGIRHQVLHSHDGLAVLELALPENHRTWFDHDMTLPTRLNPARDYNGQTFCLHRAAAARWDNTPTAGIRQNTSAVRSHTGGRVDVDFFVATKQTNPKHTVDGDVSFVFVQEGALDVSVRDTQSLRTLGAGEACGATGTQSVESVQKGTRWMTVQWRSPTAADLSAG